MSIINKTCDWCGGPIATYGGVSLGEMAFCGQKCYKEWLNSNSPKEVATCAFCGKPLGTGRIRMEDGRVVCGQACADQIMPSVQKTMKERERIQLERERLNEEKRRREEAEAAQEKRRQDADYARRHTPKSGSVSRISIHDAETRRAFPDLALKAKDPYGREVEAMDWCRLKIGAIRNESGETSGTLRLSLWYFENPSESSTSKIVWSEPLHQILEPGFTMTALEYSIAIGERESTGKRKVILSVDELHDDGNWNSTGSVQVPDWGRSIEERKAQKERRAAAKKKEKAKTTAKWILWMAGIGVVAALWHFAILPPWACITIAVLVSMILSGFFGDIL